MVEAAAAYGLTFNCDPMPFLDREVADQPYLLAVLKAAERLHARANEGR